ncbi:hypothetical protein, partial [Escherichia phage ST2]
VETRAQAAAQSSTRVVRQATPSGVRSMAFCLLTS